MPIKLDLRGGYFGLVATLLAASFPVCAADMSTLLYSAQTKNYRTLEEAKEATENVARADSCTVVSWRYNRGINNIESPTWDAILGSEFPCRRPWNFLQLGAGCWAGWEESSMTPSVPPTRTKGSTEEGAWCGTCPDYEYPTNESSTNPVCKPIPGVGGGSGGGGGGPGPNEDDSGKEDCDSSSGS